ncbi:hypothetical protein [Geothrix sp. PMB-07]|uniref:hypothetical protein n=1 Tax=Geothrix sp. PMB-07 TaxID=3068640 RepID=UPI0027410760|nr:hypothetical protein [Geothrix sp. PMB-07]WLT32166.1 hypothetical protein Q9293_02315 [Geothrix sp. PMB-07]
MTNEGLWIASFHGRPQASAQQGASDLERLRRRKDVRLLPLQRQARAILEALPGLGSADYTTGNGSASCTLREQVRDVRPCPEGTAIFGDQGGLRWLDDSWRHSVAVLNRGQDFTDTPPCLLLYGETGQLAHQITLWDPSTWEGFIDLICRHRGCWNCLETRQELPEGPGSEACPAWLLREAWNEARSERDLDLRLEPLGLKRVMALRAMEGLHTIMIDLDCLASLLDDIAEAGLPLHVRLGNQHCTQALEADISAFDKGPRAWEIQMAQTVLTLNPGSIASIWLVAQPAAKSERLRFECYDQKDDQVLTLSGPEDPCPLVQQGWQHLIGRFEAQRFH